MSVALNDALSLGDLVRDPLEQSAVHIFLFCFYLLFNTVCVFWRYGDEVSQRDVGTAEYLGSGGVEGAPHGD